MARHMVPRTRVVVIPKDGELEITLNINISLDGLVQAQQESEAEQSDEPELMIPDFEAGTTLKSFGIPTDKKETQNGR